MKKILFCSQDPGGTNALLPIIKNCERRAKKIKVFAAKYAVAIFKKNNVYSKDCTGLDYTRLKHAVETFSPEIICMGTSEGYSIEKKITKLARRKKIPTIGVIDSWMNYAQRYSTKSSPKDLLYLTDIVCVNDEFMKRGCMADGIPEERIRVTGNPHLGVSTQKIKRQPRDSKHRIGNLLFISQPPYISARKTRVRCYRILKDLLRFPRIKSFKQITVRPHPKERGARYQSLIEIYPGMRNFEIVVDNQNDLYKQIRSAGLLIGMNSMVLFEAAINGKPVVSYQPGLTLKDDLLINNHLNLSYKAYTKETFYRFLTHYLAGSTMVKKSVQDMRKKLIKPNAVQNIMRVIQGNRI